MSDLENAYLNGIRRVNDMRDEKDWKDLLGQGGPGDTTDQMAPQAKGIPSSPKTMSLVANVLEAAGLPEFWKRTNANLYAGWEALKRSPEEAYAAVDSLAKAGKLAAQGEFSHAGSEVAGATGSAMQAGFGAAGFPFVPLMAPAQAAAEQAAGILPGADEVLIEWGDARLTPRDIAGIVGMSAGAMAAPGVAAKGAQIAEALPKADIAGALKTNARGAVRVKPGDMPAGEPLPGAEVIPDVTATEPPVGEVRLNLNRIDTTANVKTVLKNINALDAPKLEASRKTVTHEQTIAGAKLVSVEDALSLPIDTLTVPERLTRLRDIHAGAGEELTSLVEKTKAGDVKAGETLVESFLVAGELDMRVEVSKRNLARGLESNRILADERRAPYDPGELAHLAEMYRGTEGGDPTILAERLSALKTPERQMTWGRQTIEFLKQNRDLAYTLYVNLLLTPISQAANFAGNNLMLGWAPVERAVSAALRPVVGGDVTFAEPLGMIRAYPEYFRTALKAANDYFWNPSAGSKVDITKAPPPTPASVYGMENTFLGQATDFIWTWGLTMNTKLLGTMDALYKPLNFGAETKALAIREAVAEKLTGDAFVERVKYIEAHPEEFPSIAEAADKFQLQQVFQDPMGPIGEAIDVLRQKVPFAKGVIPFLKTPNRVVYFAATNTFPMNFAMLGGKIGRDLVGKNATARQLAAGKLAAGTMATVAIAYYALGGYITGAGPKDPTLRKLKEATGWKPYSLKIGDEYFGYNRMDPFGMQLGMVAQTVEIVGQLPDMSADKLGMAMAMAFSENFVSKTYMQNLADLLDALDDPKSKAVPYLKGFGRTLTPGVVRTLKREMDPVQRDAQTFLETMQANTPGYSTDLPPVQNVWGEPVLVPEGWGPDWLSPIAYSIEKGDAVDKEVNRLKIDINTMPRFLFGARPSRMPMGEPKESEGVPLSPVEYAQMVKLAGEPAKRDIAKLIGTKNYQEQSDGPEGGKALLVKQVIDTHREVAKLKMLQLHPNLERLVKEKMAKRVINLMPTADLKRAGGAERFLSTLGR